MQDRANPPRIHGILRLKTDAGSPLGLSSAGPDDADILVPDDLPPHLTEMHVFPTQDAARGFTEGVKAAGSQSVAVSNACGPGNLSVLLARFSMDRPLATGLDETVCLVLHGAADKCLDAARHDEILCRRAQRVQDTKSSWSGVAKELAGLPPMREHAKDEFKWRMAELEFGDDGTASVNGTLDPDPVLTGNSPAHDEYRIHLRHVEDGTITATLNFQSVGLGMSTEQARWRAGEMEAACRDVGWEFVCSHPFSATWSNPTGTGTSGLRSALLEVPELVRTLSPIVNESRRVEQAQQFARHPHLVAVLNTMLSDPDARIRFFDPSGKPPTVHSARLGELRTGMGTIEHLLDSGCLWTDNAPTTGNWKSLTLSDRGRRAAMDQAMFSAESIAEQTVGSMRTP